MAANRFQIHGCDCNQLHESQDDILDDQDHCVVRKESKRARHGTGEGQGKRHALRGGDIEHCDLGAPVTHVPASFILRSGVPAAPFEKCRERDDLCHAKRDLHRVRQHGFVILGP